MIIPLETPFIYEDIELTEIDLDLAKKMNPRLQELCEDEFRRKLKGDIVPMPYLDSRFRLLVAEKITKLPQAALLQLPFETYNIIHNAITFFFVNSQEPSTEIPPDSEETGDLV